MADVFVFGYGSLVNRATHAYGAPTPAKINGWRRIWRHVEGRSVAFLTVTRDPACSIDGLIAAVPDADWNDLDARERSYLRETATGVLHNLTPPPEIRIYHAPSDLHRPADRHHPILLSYLDVVVQGFHQVHGQDGVARFFDTTDGWDAPVLNDRAAPRYARHQTLSRLETDLVDTELARRNVRILT